MDDYAGALRLDGQGFVVLGAGGGGIGEQVCTALSQLGARLLCVDCSAKEAESVARRVNGVPCVANAIERDGMARIFDEAKSNFGASLSGVVDVIGVPIVMPVTQFDDEKLAKQFDTVLRHVILAIQIGAPLIEANGGGSMTFIGSVAGIRSIPNQTMYGAAKAALHHTVRTAAHELGPSGVRVNAVAPGFVRTPSLLKLIPEESWQRIADTNPMRRVADPSDVARAVLFLASDLARYVTGNVMMLDGGMTLVAALPPYQRLNGP